MITKAYNSMKDFFKTKFTEYWIIYYITIMTILLFTITSCGDKDDDMKMASIQVALVDAPADYDSVLIDVQDIQVNVNGDDQSWVSLSGFSPQVYDILKLTNGQQAILGDIIIPEGKLSQIRMILGDNNQLYIDSNIYDLKVPSGSQSGLKVKVDATIVGGITHRLILDFDAAKSIVKAGNSGKYILKPVIRAEMEALTGAIQGYVYPAPDSVSSVIYAIKGLDTASTYPDATGKYRLTALVGGVYDILAVPDSSSGLSPVQSAPITLSVGKLVEVDTLVFTN